MSKERKCDISELFVMFFQVQHKPPQHCIPVSAGNLQLTSGCPSLPPFASPTPSAQISGLKLDIFMIQAWYVGIQQAGSEAYLQKWAGGAYQIIYHLSVILVQVSNTHTTQSAHTYTEYTHPDALTQVDTL